jgi:hypothetical protein
MRVSSTLSLSAVGITLGLFVVMHLESVSGSALRWERQARIQCPSDTVVWVNKRSHIYHFTGTRYYANTKLGSFECESDARAAGNRAAFDENHP